MKNLSLLIFSAIVFSSCVNRNYLSYRDEDKGLANALKRLEKDPNDAKALEAVPILYKNVQVTELANIKRLGSSRELNRWDGIINSYTNLQSLYNQIMGNRNAYALITPASYEAELDDAKQSAAAEYYNYGVKIMDKGDISRTEARSAFTALTKASNYSLGYKNSKQLAAEAYNLAVINVVINPISDNSFFRNSGWGNNAYSYGTQYFQDALLRELQASEDRYAARFYSGPEARRNNVMPDWVADISLLRLQVPQPITNSNTYKRSARIESGKDTSGKVTYETVNATVTLRRTYFEAYADVRLGINDLENRKTVTDRTFRENFDWSIDYGSYRGDSRALTASDRQAVNNSYQQPPTRDEVLSEIYRRLYPQVKSEIQNAVEW